MDRFTSTLFKVAALSLLILHIGSAADDLNDKTLKSLDIDKLVKVVEENVSATKETKCLALDAALRKMLSETSDPSATKPLVELFDQVAQLFDSRKTEKSGSVLNVLNDCRITRPEDKPLRTVIASPPREPIRQTDGGEQLAERIAKEFQNVKSNLKDHGQDIYMSQEDHISLDRLDMAELSRIAQMNRKSSLEKRCNALDAGLRTMLQNHPIATATRDVLFEKVKSSLSKRKLPFGNNMPSLDLLNECHMASVGKLDDFDADEDGVPDNVERYIDQHKNDLDLDHDGGPDSVERFIERQNRDADHDGIPDSAERYMERQRRDSDQDGIPDVVEDYMEKHKYDPDRDHDGVPDSIENFIEKHGRDSDHDGIPDTVENYIDAQRRDLDHDGIPDAVEEHINRSRDSDELHYNGKAGLRDTFGHLVNGVADKIVDKLDGDDYDRDNHHSHDGRHHVKPDCYGHDCLPEGYNHEEPVFFGPHQRDDFGNDKHVFYGPHQRGEDLNELREQGWKSGINRRISEFMEEEDRDRMIENEEDPVRKLQMTLDDERALSNRLRNILEEDEVRINQLNGRIAELELSLNNKGQSSGDATKERVRFEMMKEQYEQALEREAKISKLLDSVQKKFSLLESIIKDEIDDSVDEKKVIKNPVDLAKKLEGKLKGGDSLTTRCYKHFLLYSYPGKVTKTIVKAVAKLKIQGDLGLYQLPVESQNLINQQTQELMYSGDSIATKVGSELRTCMQSTSYQIKNNLGPTFARNDHLGDFDTHIGSKRFGRHPDHGMFNNDHFGDDFMDFAAKPKKYSSFENYNNVKPVFGMNPGAQFREQGPTSFRSSSASGSGSWNFANNVAETTGAPRPITRIPPIPKMPGFPGAKRTSMYQRP